MILIKGPDLGHSRLTASFGANFQLSVSPFVKFAQ